MRTKLSPRKLIVGAAAVALLFSLAACNDDDKKSADKGEVVAQVDTLTGVDTEVALDQGFVDALTSLKLAPGVVGNATLKNGTLSFPITGGHVTYYKPGSIDPYVQGIIEHDGSGISLTAGGTEVDLTDFAIDPGTSKLYGNVSVNGKSAATHAFIFQLDGRTLKPLATGPNDTAILEGTLVKISPDAADLLNSTFNTDAVKAGLLVGVAKITINTK